MKLGEIQKWFWTDSKVVIGYIKNDTKRFKTFSANIVQQLIENTDVEQRCYVRTRENFADGDSKRLNAARVHSSRMRTIGLKKPNLMLHLHMKTIGGLEQRILS